MEAIINCFPLLVHQTANLLAASANLPRLGGLAKELFKEEVRLLYHVRISQSFCIECCLCMSCLLHVPAKEDLTWVICGPSFVEISWLWQKSNCFLKSFSSKTFSLTLIKLINPLQLLPNILEMISYNISAKSPIASLLFLISAFSTWPHLVCN